MRVIEKNLQSTYSYSLSNCSLRKLSPAKLKFKSQKEHSGLTLWRSESEKIQHSSTKMFHFDGSYKRSPIQNLGGSSYETDRQTLIKKAQIERKKREETRQKEVSSLKLQSFFRQVKSSSWKNCIIIVSLPISGATSSDSRWSSASGSSSRITSKPMDYTVSRILNFFWSDFFIFTSCETATSSWVSRCDLEVVKF